MALRGQGSRRQLEAGEEMALRIRGSKRPLDSCEDMVLRGWSRIRQEKGIGLERKQVLQ